MEQDSKSINIDTRIYNLYLATTTFTWDAAEKFINKRLENIVDNYNRKTAEGTAIINKISSVITFGKADVSFIIKTKDIHQADDFRVELLNEVKSMKEIIYIPMVKVIFGNKDEIKNNEVSSRYETYVFVAVNNSDGDINLTSIVHDIKEILDNFKETIYYEVYLTLLEGGEILLRLRSDSLHDVEKAILSMRNKIMKVMDGKDKKQLVTSTSSILGVCPYKDESLSNDNASNENKKDDSKDNNSYGISYYFKFNKNFDGDIWQIIKDELMKEINGSDNGYVIRRGNTEIIKGDPQWARRYYYWDNVIWIKVNPKIPIEIFLKISMNSLRTLDYVEMVYTVPYFHTSDDGSAGRVENISNNMEIQETSYKNKERHAEMEEVLNNNNTIREKINELEKQIVEKAKNMIENNDAAENIKKFIFDDIFSGIFELLERAYVRTELLERIWERTFHSEDLKVFENMKKVLEKNIDDIENFINEILFTGYLDRKIISQQDLEINLGNIMKDIYDNLCVLDEVLNLLFHHYWEIKEGRQLFTLLEPYMNIGGLTGIMNLVHRGIRKLIDSYCIRLPNRPSKGSNIVVVTRNTMPDYKVFSQINVIVMPLEFKIKTMYRLPLIAHELAHHYLVSSYNNLFIKAREYMKNIIEETMSFKSELLDERVDEILADFMALILASPVYIKSLILANPFALNYMDEDEFTHFSLPVRVHYISKVAKYIIDNYANKKVREVIFNDEFFKTGREASNAEISKGEFIGCILIDMIENNKELKELIKNYIKEWEKINECKEYLENNENAKIKILINCEPRILVSAANLLGVDNYNDMQIWLSIIYSKTRDNEQTKNSGCAGNV